MNITEIQRKSRSSDIFMIIFPVLVLVSGLFLFIFVVPQTYTGVINKLNASKEQKTNYENLQKKISVLQSTSPQLLEGTTKAVAVLPDRNSVLPFISQMKNLAIEKNVVVTDIRSNAISDLGDAKRLEFEISLQGESLDSLSSFLLDLSNRAPLMTLDDTVISAFDKSITAKVKMSVYWSPLPTSLPALTDALPPFSSDEIKILDQFNSYQIPDSTILPPSAPSPRDNPFN